MIQSKEDEVELVFMAITHPAGFDFDIGGTLCIRRYEYPIWAVEEEVTFGGNVGKYNIKEFDDPRKAAEYFVERRHALQLGLDFEEELWKEINNDKNITKTE